MGVAGGIRPTRATSRTWPSRCPTAPANHWGVIGISRAQWRLLAAAPSLGGNVRVGLEDNFYLPDGEMARSNGDLVARAARMADDAGRRPATVDEARELLGPGEASRDAARSRACASSTSRGCCPAASARCCSPTSAPTCSRSRTPAWATTSAGRRRTTTAPRTRRSRRCSSRSTAASARSGSNLKEERGREVLLRLVREHDVLLESFRPGRARPPRRGLRAAARGEPGARLLRDHRLRPGRPATATAPATT